MKMQVTCFMLVTAMALVGAETPQDDFVGDLDKTILPNTSPGLDVSFEDTSSEGQDKGMKVVYSGTELNSLTLTQASDLDPKFAYAIRGEMRCEDGWPGSYLQLRTWKLTVTPNPPPNTFGRMLSDERGGSPFDIKPSSDWRPFSLRVDTEQFKIGVGQIELRAYLSGPCTLHLRNMKLVKIEPPMHNPNDGEVMEIDPMQQQYLFMGQSEITQSGGSLLSLSYPKVTAPYFALMGDVRTRDALPSSMELTVQTVPAAPGVNPPVLIARNDADSGVMAKFEGTSDEWRPFAVPFDASGLKTRITSIVGNLIPTVTGGRKGRIYVRNVRLVEFPHGFPAAWGTVPPPRDLREVRKEEIKSIEVKIANGSGGLSIVVNGDKYENFERMKARVLFLHMMNTDAPVNLHLDRALDYSVVQQAMDAFRECKLSPKVVPEGEAPSSVASLLDRPALTEAFLKTQSEIASLQATIQNSDRTPQPSVTIALNQQIKEKQALLQTLQNELAQSPDPAAGGVPSVGGTSIDWKSFLLGVVLTLGVGAFTASISIMRRVVKRRAHEKELRRIESIDG